MATGGTASDEPFVRENDGVAESRKRTLEEQRPGHHVVVPPEGMTFWVVVLRQHADKCLRSGSGLLAQQHLGEYKAWWPLRETKREAMERFLQDTGRWRRGCFYYEE